mgnify:CR=1 FL=1
MKRGSLKQYVTVQQNTPPIATSGEQTDSWCTFATRFAEFLPERAREFVAARQINAEVQYVARIDGYAAITNTMRVLHSDGRVFDIAGIRPEDSKSPANSRSLLLDLIEGKRKES